MLVAEPDPAVPVLPLLDHADRPQSMLRAFVDRPLIEPAVKMTPTALQAMFVLESCGGSRKMDTVATVMSCGDSRQATKTEKTLGTLFKTDPGGLVVKQNRTLVLAAGVMSDYRWIAALSDVVGRASGDRDLRWSALSELLGEASRITAPAYGDASDSSGFAWALAYDQASFPAGEATRILVDALANAGTGWVDLAATDPVPVIPGVHVVRMLLRVQTLFSDDDAVALLYAAAHVAAKTGDSSRFQVQHSVRLRKADGWEPPEDLLDLLEV